MSKRNGPEIGMDLAEATRRARTFAKQEWDRAEVTDKYEDETFYIIKGVSPSGAWTVMFEKRSGKMVIPR